MNSSSDAAEGVWYWGDGDKPYCNVSLSPPKNGALSCDMWMFGKQCMMQCNDQFDLPLVGAHGLIGSCPQGTYLNTTSKECKECNKGTFKSDINAESCTRCPPNTTTLGSGSKNMSDCIVNGDWNTWENWSACSVTCGGGISKRVRQCNNPPPEKDGKPCIGSMSQTLECGIKVCPIVL
ncbi:hypothetical protein KUTeg_018502 [Tegillarca granosa]|uniref:Tyrosine-protein kinase ephrin type A/B receptor-like domain-containing protein n=1 Tax=Tegillarca granosa TaxID=220873 RepID=A0ABQ9EJG3_TEGGR|nr:hypothetical protein KUTeg_018502 [Tegillarca granosa]